LLYQRIAPEVARAREHVAREQDEDRKEREELIKQENERREWLAMEQRKYQQEEMEGGTLAVQGLEVGVFGVSLATLMEREGIAPPRVPFIVDLFLNYLEHHGTKKIPIESCVLFVIILLY
jgi:hypothetical protein